MCFDDMGGKTSKLIAIIDDDETVQDSLRDLMEAAGLVPQCFGSAKDFLSSGLHIQAACLITDILMPKMSGLQLQARLKDEGCDIPIIFITADGDAGMRIQGMRDGAVALMSKPFDHHVLLKTVRAALIFDQERRPLRRWSGGSTPAASGQCRKVVLAV